MGARRAALATLSRAIVPRSRSVFARLVGMHEDTRESPLVVESIARSLLAVGGDEGRKAVELRARRTHGVVGERLRRLLA